MVAHELAAWIVTVHMIVALVIVLLLYVTVRAFPAARFSTSAVPSHLRWGLGGQGPITDILSPQTLLMFPCLELTVMRAAMNVSFGLPYPVLLLVLWAFGMSMVTMAALIHLPLPALAAVSALSIVGHNAFDGVRAATLGGWAPVWNLLHQQGLFVVRSPGYDRFWTLKFKVPVTPVRRTSIRHEPVAPLDVVNVPVFMRSRL